MSPTFVRCIHHFSISSYDLDGIENKQAIERCENGIKSTELRTAHSRPFIMEWRVCHLTDIIIMRLSSMIRAYLRN